MRRAARKDGNDRPITLALVAVGASVQDLTALGKRVPDKLVGYRGANYVIEIKNPDTRYGRGEDNAHGTQEGQAEWRASWRGQSAVVSTPEEALAVIGARAGISASRVCPGCDDPTCRSEWAGLRPRT